MVPTGLGGRRAQSARGGPSTTTVKCSSAGAWAATPGAAARANATQERQHAPGIALALGDDADRGVVFQDRATNIFNGEAPSLSQRGVQLVMGHPGVGEHRF